MGNKGKLTRRSFVAAATAAAGALAMTSCQSETKVEKAEDASASASASEAASSAEASASSAQPTTASAYVAPDVELTSEGKWIPSVCWNNCGGMCENKVFVQDGVVVRQKTDDLGEDNYETLQFRACPRGRAHRQDSLGVDRLKYPMKRKNWSSDNPQGELRGKDEWERITWDEAFEIIASETKKIGDTNGESQIMYAGVSSAFGPLSTCMNAAGVGGFSVGSTMSFGSACWNFVLNGLPYLGIGEGNDRTDFVNAETIVFYGANPAQASPGSYTYLFDEAKQNGTQFVFVGPEYNVSAAHFDARWIRVRPGTDIAFLLAVAFDMFENDEKNGRGSVIDWDFLDKYVLGIDGDHMPEDAKVDENFRDYVMGAYDDTPKNAEWATKICGTPVEDIHWYAELMGKDNVVSILRTNAPFRTNDSDDLLPLYMAIGFMGGHVGKPGHACDCAYHNTIGSPSIPIFTVGDSGAPWGPANPITGCVNDDEQWQAVLDGHFNDTGNITFGVLTPEKQTECNIRMLVFDGVGDINTQLNTSRAIEAIRSVDFVVSTARAYTSQAKYADVVLPVLGEWETVGRIRAGYTANQTFYNREAYIVGTRVIEPMFETRSDQEIGRGLAEALGLNPDELYPVPELQQFYNQLAGTTLVEPEKGETVPMFSITQEDIDTFGGEGVEGTPQDGFMPLADILRDGIYRVPRKQGDVYTYYGYQDYLADPEKNPRDTPSGKIEIYCQTRADALNAAGRTKNGPEWKPYPTYRAPLNGYEASFVDGNIDGEKGEFPYQIFNPHYLRRSHTQFDNVPWLRHAFANPIYISAADAEEKGIKTGDWVRIWNNAGQVLRPASVTQRMMPGVVALPHGPWVDIDEETGIDRAGTDNMLTEPVSSGCGTAGYNTNLVNFEKWEETLEDDYLLEPRIPVLNEA